MKQKYEEVINNMKYRIVYEAYLYRLVKSKIRFVETSKSFTYFATKLLILCMQKLNTYKLIVRDYQVLVMQTQYNSFIYKFKSLAKKLAHYTKNGILTQFIQEHNINEPEIQQILKNIKNHNDIMKYIDLSDLVEPQDEQKIQEKVKPQEKETLQLKEIAKLNIF